MKPRFADILLLAAVCVLVFVVMFSHMTGVRNIATVVAAVGLLANWRAERAQPSLPMTPTPRIGASLLLPMLLWAAWAAASIGWSILPAESAASWLDEIVCPFIVFAAFYRMASVGRVVPRDLAAETRRDTDSEADPGRPRYAFAVEMVCWLATAGLAWLSVGEIGKVAGSTAVDAVAQPWLAGTALPAPFSGYLGGAAATAALAVIVIPFFMLLMQRTAHRPGVVILARLAGATGIVLALAAGGATRQPMFAFSAAVMLVIGGWPLLRRRPWLATPIAVAVLVLGGWTSFATQSPDVMTALSGWQRSSLASSHIAIAQGAAHAWLGVGLGKPLPTLIYGGASPGPLIGAWLQTGIVGVALVCLLLCALVRAFVSGAAPANTKAAGVALIVGVLVNTLVDDPLQQSVALAFWAHAGWLLGRTHLAAALRQRTLSGRSVAMRRLRRVGN